MRFRQHFRSCVGRREQSNGRLRLPAQDAIVPLDEPCDPTALDLFDTGDQLRALDPPVREIPRDRVERNLRRDDRLDVPHQVGPLHRAGAETKSFRVLVEERVVHGVTTKQDGDVGAAILHGVAEPECGVVLLLDGCAARSLDDAQISCHGSPHSVPIRRTPSERSQYFQASTGDPRQTPSIWFSTPRSSTQSPQLHQTSFTCFSLANARSALIHSFGFGWSSSSIEAPCTAFGCCFCPAYPSAV